MKKNKKTNECTAEKKQIEFGLNNMSKVSEDQ